ncbi:unnamed protein product [Pleuronectes platessa]|uniref:Uncharacterized protein n=1 Tax=Pleuronectes platessa TaxID=8262 RepID=A0A9N7YR32_PLEPL|nr:unnamed protein product [Pleuronectes platessa]
MQKRCGNGVQGKQAVRAHKRSRLETKPGPDWGGHRRRRRAGQNSQAELERQQKKIDSGEKTSPQQPVLPAWMLSLSPLCVPFVSSSLFFTFTLPPYLLFLMAEQRHGKKERVSETDREEKRDEEEDGDGEGR